MSTWINVCRYHLTEWTRYLVTPWALLAFLFTVNLVTASTRTSPPGRRL